MKCKKIISLIIAVVLCTLSCSALCDEGEDEVVESVLLDGESETDVPLESAPSLDDVAAANMGSVLMQSHYSVANYVFNYSYSDGETYTSEGMSALISTDGEPAYYESNDALDAVYDGTTRYLIYADGTMGLNICLDDTINSYYTSSVSSFALYTHIASETLTSCSRKASSYTLTTSMTHGDLSSATGVSYGLDDSTPIITSVTVDANTLAVTEWSLTAQPGDGISIPLKQGTVLYDSTSLPEGYYLMAQPDATRTLTLITDPASASSQSRTFTVPEGAIPYVIAPDGYYTAIMSDSQQFIEPDDGDIPLYGDLTLYLVRE